MEQPRGARKLGPPSRVLKRCGVKLAVTDCAALIVTVQMPVPVHAPLQPPKVEPAAGVAVRVTGVPLS